MILFHFTKPDYLNSILTEGLIPDGANKKLGKSGMARNLSWPWVFLTDNPDYIVEHQCGRDWARILLEVDCTGLNVIPHRWLGTDADGKDRWSPHEFTYSGHIEPNRIKICASTY